MFANLYRMKHFLAIAAMLAIMCEPAFAQFAPTPNSKVDLAPVINPLIQIGGLIITGLCIPLMWIWIGRTLKSWGIEATAELNATRAVTDGIAQTAIGKAINKYAVLPGQITVDVKSDIIADAAKSLVANAGDSLTKLGVKDNEKFVKAKEMIEARIGLMDAAAAGAPVLNPSQPAVVVAAPIEAPKVVDATKDRPTR